MDCDIIVSDVLLQAPGSVSFGTKNSIPADWIYTSRQLTALYITPPHKEYACTLSRLIVATMVSTAKLPFQSLQPFRQGLFTSHEYIYLTCIP